MGLSGFHRLGDLPANFATYICSRVFEKSHEIGLIYVDFDGDLGCLCNDDEHDHNNADNIMLVGFGHLRDRHEGIANLVLGPGFEATLNQKSEWEIRPTPEEE